VRKEYDRDGQDSDYDGTTGGRPVLYAGVTWAFPTLTPDSGHIGFDVALHTGSDPEVEANRVGAIRRIADITALDAALKIPSQKSGTSAVNASVRAVFRFGPGPWATSGATSTRTTGTVVVPGVSTVGAISTTPAANALTIGGTGNHTITAHASGVSTEGILVAAAQDIPSGTKTFNSDITLATGGGYKITFSDGTFMTTAPGSGGITQLTGDVTAGPGSGSQAATIASAAVTTSKLGTSAVQTTNIGANQVTNAKLAQMATMTIKGNDSGSTADPSDLSISQVQAIVGTTGGTGGSPTVADAIIFGSGGEGNLSISSGTTQLAHDTYYADLTISGTAKLQTNGWRVFVSGTLDISGAPAGAISLNGDNGVSSTTSTGGTGGQPPFGPFSNTIGFPASSGSAGGNGASGTGGGSGGASPASPGNGGRGGQGGTGGLGVLGAGSGGAGAATGVMTPYPVFALSQPFMVKHTAAGYALIAGGGGGTGGGGGGGNNAGGAGGGGGGGGCGGGVIFVAARTVARGSSSTAGIIAAKGGNGGNGANTPSGANTGGGAGGGGGGGGWIFVTFRFLTGSTITAAIDYSGGGGGTAGNGVSTGTGGDGGASGSSGLLVVFDVGAGTSTNYAIVAGSAGSAHSGTTGGAGAAVNTAQTNL
jgi:hypothetical protein